MSFIAAALEIREGRDVWEVWEFFLVVGENWNVHRDVSRPLHCGRQMFTHTVHLSVDAS